MEEEIETKKKVRGFIKNTKTGEVFPVEDSGKEILIIRDDKKGLEINLSSSSQSMGELINSAWVIKQNFFKDNQEEVKRGYI